MKGLTVSSMICISLIESILAASTGTLPLREYCWGSTLGDDDIFRKVPARWSTSFLPVSYRCCSLTCTVSTRIRYSLDYKGRENIASTECLIFAVAPLSERDSGRFRGEIWIDSSSYGIVRAKGVFTGPYERWYRGSGKYFHFDSWRQRVGDGWWLPGVTYFDERRVFRTDGNLEFHYRGYAVLWRQHDDHEDREDGRLGRFGQPFSERRGGTIICRRSPSCSRTGRTALEPTCPAACANPERNFTRLSVVCSLPLQWKCSLSET